jgi:hypothetical protein
MLCEVMTERFRQNGKVFETLIGSLMTTPYNCPHPVLLLRMSHHSTWAFDGMWRFSNIPIICLATLARRKPLLQSVSVDCYVRPKATRERTIDPSNETGLNRNSHFIPNTRLFVEFVRSEHLPILLLVNPTICPIDTKMSVMSCIPPPFIKANLTNR